MLCTDQAREATSTVPNIATRTGTGRRLPRRVSSQAAAKIRGQIRNTCPWTDRDQKCWNGEAVEWSAA